MGWLFSTRGRLRNFHRSHGSVSSWGHINQLRGFLHHRNFNNKKKRSNSDLRTTHWCYICTNLELLPIFWIANSAPSQCMPMGFELKWWILSICYTFICLVMKRIDILLDNVPLMVLECVEGPLLSSIRFSYGTISFVMLLSTKAVGLYDIRPSSQV